MFEDCNTLAELNAARIVEVQTHPAIEVNNAYNARRVEILNARRNFTKITPVFVTIAEPVRYGGIPLGGRSDEVGVIKLTERGFLY